MTNEDKKTEKRLIVAGLSCLGCFGLIFLTVVISGLILYQPLLANYHYSNGLSEKKRGFPIKSKQEFSQAIKYDINGDIGKKAKNFIKFRLPKSSNITMNAIRYNIEGYNYEIQKNPKNAIIYYNKAIKESPEFEWPYSNLAMVYFYYYKDNNKAIELLNKSLQINQYYYNANLNIAKIYFEMGIDAIQKKHTDKAKELFEKSLKQYQKVKNFDFKAEQNTKRLDYKIQALKEYLTYIKKLRQNKTY